MITVNKVHNLIVDFVYLQNKKVIPDGDQIPLRLYIPTEALNALMSDFTGRPNAPDFAFDEDNLFYGVYHWENVLLDICEGKAYRIETIVPNQDIEKDLATDDPLLPGYGPTNAEEIPKKKLQPKGPKTPKLELV